ncbi:MAG: T9SS type A sorting domain-containing protein [Ignavibacteria bacterium]|nr:T9SS type A sorting domain-containing protein [Ignavibacteria bacterium]
MKKITFFLILFLGIVNFTNAQMIDSLWYCAYATWDDQPNSTGYNTPSVGVFSENNFVALVNRPTNNTAYLVAYKNADSANGRIGRYPYGTSGVGGYRQQWISGFDVVDMLKPWDIAVGSDSLVYVANNDTVDRNILVFAVRTDSVYSTEWRMSTGDNKPIFGIDVDQAGLVYVTKEGDSTNAGKVLVYNSINNDVNWGFLHSSTPLQTITLPEPGYIRGVAVNKAGTLIYVSNYTTRKIYCYTGSPATGYTKYTGFNFTYNDTVPNSPTSRPGPMGMKIMPTKNLLFVACDVLLGGSAAYSYGRAYVLNPNTGERLGMIDMADWNYKKTGSYSNRGDGGKQGDVSGYTSVYNVDVDNSFNLYSVSHYGWTVDKWKYNGTLPTVPIVILSVEKTDKIPTSFELHQNYPNPFNPQTTIEFSVIEKSNVSLIVYNSLGELVTELIGGAEFEKGNYKVTFDASKLASGTYIYSLKNAKQTLNKKMSLIK